MESSNIDRFDPALWLDQALNVLTLRLKHEVGLTRALRGSDRQDAFLGLFLTDDEASAILDELAGQLVSEVPDTAHLDSLTAELSAQRIASQNSIWYKLATRCNLTEFEMDVLVLAAAPALDPRFGRVFGYLNDDMTRRHLTPALALRLLDYHPIGLSALRAVFSTQSPLCQHQLLSVERTQPAMEAAIRIDETALDRLLHQESDLTVVGIASTGNATLGKMVVDQSSDYGTTLIAMAADAGLDICLIETTQLDVTHSSQVLASQLRDAHLSGALPVIVESQQRDMTSLASNVTTPCVVCSHQASAWYQYGFLEVPTAYTKHTREQALGLIDTTKALAQQLQGIPANVPVHSVLALYPDELSQHSSKQVLSSQTEASLGHLANCVNTTFTLKDIVLPAPTLTALHSLIHWHDTATTVLSDWGLGTTFNKQHALVSLFSGPPGTGKTMAASVIANALGLPLYRVDLASMVSKYIGETEKNLDQLFTAAENVQVVLFFDEADAVFGQRSEVQDSHDRYANLETSYLLQRMESFAGISILATNLAQNMDDAFLRRIDTVVEFPAPAQLERLALWKRIEHTKAPISSDVDLSYLAERFELTGGEIRNCWLTAAHTAAHERSDITMSLVMRAIASELTKQSKAIRKSDFGSHYASLRAAGAVS